MIAIITYSFDTFFLNFELQFDQGITEGENI